MNKIFTTAIFLIANIFYCHAQDTIRSQDMPSTGSIYVFSNVDSFPGFNRNHTGVNYDWDFSDLGRASQHYDTIHIPAETDSTVSFYFIDNALNSNRANLAHSGKSYKIGFTQLNNIVDYCYNSNSRYEQPGLSAEINSAIVPVFYTPHDVLYNFPLKYGDEDSVSYEYDVDLSSSIGFYYHVFITRHNKIDGWGTLTTPFGEFSVVRVNSKIIRQDSTFVVSLNMGIKTAPVTTHEYKWLSPGLGLPLLQINTASGDSVTWVQYQDSVHLTRIGEVNSILFDASVFPNPASKELYVTYLLKKKSNVTFNLFSYDGRMIFEIREPQKSPGINANVFDLEKYSLSDGYYILKIKAGDSFITKSVEVQNR